MSCFLCDQANHPPKPIRITHVLAGHPEIPTGFVVQNEKLCAACSQSFEWLAEALSGNGRGEVKS